MWEKIGFCIVCFIGMVVGEVLANRIDKWFASRTNSKNEMKNENEIEMEIRNQNVNESVNNLKNKIDGR